MSNKRKFAKMYDNYADDIFRFLLVHVRNVHTAEDLTAETFLKGWKNFGSFDGRHQRGWLYAIARNTLTDYWRKHKSLPLDEGLEIIDEPNDSIEDKVDKKLAVNRLARAVAALPKDMRSVINLRFMQGYSARHTAEALGLSEANVRVMQYRALKKLKGALS